jgi:hypothetical protein
MNAAPVDSETSEQTIEPYISAADLKERSRIGLSLAIDWITMPGRSMTPQSYNQLHDEAMRDFVAVMSKAPAVLATQVILGSSLEDNPSKEKWVDPSLWYNIGVTEDEFDTFSWQMLLVDLNSDETGQIVSMTGSRKDGWCNLNVSTDFLLENWPAIDQKPRQPHRRTSKTSFKSHMTKICAAVPPRV